MPVGRGPNTKSIPLNIVGSSVYGIYDKQDSQRTINLTISDDALVVYPGYKIGIKFDKFGNATEARGLYESVKLNKIFAVFDDRVYEITLIYDHIMQRIDSYDIQPIGNLDTTSGPVYFTENNKPQILISDSAHLYLYDPSILAGSFSFTATSATELTFNGYFTFAVGEPVVFSGGGLPIGITAGTTYYISSSSHPDSAPNTTVVEISTTPTNAANGVVINTFAGGSGTMTTSGPFQDIPTSFTPGYITFHDTYFIAAASNDNFYLPPANNTWRLSAQNNGFVWADIAQSIGLLETKPDNTQAVVRFPSKGNMILVMGRSVTEMWFDTGAQLFPYQRQDQGSIDYGCVSPATVAFMDEIVIWLASNEKSGPIIMYSTGGLPTKITTDGIDFQLSQINHPESSQGFLYRKNGHLFYHLNFYRDNISFVVDLTLNKIYNACDEFFNYYIMGQVVWFNNQYFSISKNTGNLYIFDTVFTTYESTDVNGTVTTSEIPRIRICDNIRLPSQDYFVFNDVGFTIETGATDYLVQATPPLDDIPINILMENGNFFQLENNNLLISEQEDPDPNIQYVQSTPRVDLSVSYDGGVTFGGDMAYILNPIGKRRNRLMWWQLGAGNDCVCQFRFWGIGRVVALNGVANIRQ